MTVSDTGPGLHSGRARTTFPSGFAGAGRTVSTGVGLANIRDRLAQAYGESTVSRSAPRPTAGSPSSSKFRTSAAEARLEGPKPLPRLDCYIARLPPGPGI